MFFWTFAGFLKTQYERTQVLVELNPRYVYMQFAVPNNIEGVPPSQMSLALRIHAA
jgi:hypothetical protein